MSSARAKGFCGDSGSDWKDPPPAHLCLLPAVHPDSSSLVLSEVYLLASFLNHPGSRIKGTTLRLNLCKCSLFI